ncbi:MAG: hypothetical protein ABIM50_08640 [Novosphingobium sp.]
MRRLKLLLALAAIVSAAVSAEAGADERQAPSGRGRHSYADPSAVITAELAFARLAQEKGQWTAFSATAASDAVMFAPQMVLAQQWLKGRANPPVAVKWQPHQVWSSCDGSLMVSHGAWQGPRRTGYFTTLWQRQRDGGYKWIYDGGDTLAQPLAAPEMISAQIADCPPRMRQPARAAGNGAEKNDARSSRAPLPFDPAHRSGQSNDGSLRWTVTVSPGGARSLNVIWKKDGADVPFLHEEVSEQAP